MELRPIKTETDYQNTLKRLEFVFDAPIGSQESDEADILALMVDEYEKRHYFIDAPDPIEALKIRMEQLNF